MKTLTYTAPLKPIGKPRMTRSDKWKKRPCVVRYREFADALRLYCAGIPIADRIEKLSVTANFTPPASWSKKEKAAAIGTMMRQKPDPDNILKAVMDPLWANDERMGDIGSVKRRWADRNELVIEVDVAGEAR